MRHPWSVPVLLVLAALVETRLERRASITQASQGTYGV